MLLADFSFKNPQILGYFNGSNAYIPSSELIYIHSHPLIKPNFVDELEALILKATLIIQKRNIKGAVVDQFTKYAREFGAELPDITNDNAKVILENLRGIYKLCNNLLKNNNVVNS